LALSSCPSVEETVYRYSTAAGSPHLAAPSLSMYAGHSRNITLSIGTPVPFIGRKRALADSEARTALLIHLSGLTRLAWVRDLPVLLDRLEQAGGPADPVPSADGWELVLAENVAYLVDDQLRWDALAELRRVVGLAPEQILAAPEEVLRSVVAGARPAERVQRLRRCAELAIAGAPWRAYPGIGQPGQDRIDLFTAARAVLALDANGLRVLTRLGYAAPARSYSVGYRQAQTAASARLPAEVPALQRAFQLLRRHGRAVCRRKDPACAGCAIAGDCPSVGHPPPLY
jgi:hypothetical protein